MRILSFARVTLQARFYQWRAALSKYRPRTALIVYLQSGLSSGRDSDDNNALGRIPAESIVSHSQTAKWLFNLGGLFIFPLFFCFFLGGGGGG